VANSLLDEFQCVSLFSIKPDEPLPFSVFVHYHGQFLIYRTPGQVFEVSKYNRFIYKRISKVYIPAQEMKFYEKYLRSKDEEEDIRLNDPMLTVEQRHNILTTRAITGVTRELFQSVDDSSFQQNTDIVIHHAKETVERVCSKPYLRIFEAIPEKSNTVIAHSIRVSLMSTYLAYQLGFVNAIPLEHIAAAGMLHDIGKTRLPLSDDLELTEEDEAEVMHQHPQLSCEMLKQVPSVPEEVLRIIMEHHENKDGSGYPNKLRGRKMHGLSKVFVIANTFDNLVAGLQGDRDTRYQTAAHLMDSKLRHCFETAVLPRALKLILGQGRLK